METGKLLGYMPDIKYVDQSLSSRGNSCGLTKKFLENVAIFAVVCTKGFHSFAMTLRHKVMASRRFVGT